MSERDHHGDGEQSSPDGLALDAVDRIVGEAVHDLRAPIAGIVAAARLLARSDAAPETVERLVAIIDRSEATVESIIDDLVERAQRAQQRLPAARALTSIRPVLDRAAQVVEAARSVETAVDADPSLEAWTDAVSLFRLVQNLLDNAARHSGCKRVRLTAAPEGSKIVIEVADDGPGLSEVAIGVLSGPAETGVGADAGLGLGLFTARHLAGELGGSLEVDPDWPGVRLLITLPQRGARADGHAPQP